MLLLFHYVTDQSTTHPRPAHRRSHSSPPSLAEAAVSQHRTIRVHQAHDRANRTFERSLQSFAQSSERNLQQLLSFEENQAREERQSTALTTALDREHGLYSQSLAAAMASGPEHVEAFTRHTPFPNSAARFAALDVDAQPRRLMEPAALSLLGSNNMVDSPQREVPPPEILSSFAGHLCEILECTNDEPKVQSIEWLVQNGVTSMRDLAVATDSDLKDEDGTYHGAFNGHFFRNNFLSAVEQAQARASLEPSLSPMSNSTMGGPSPNENDVGMANSTMEGPSPNENEVGMGAGQVDPNRFGSDPTVWFQPSVGTDKLLEVLNNPAFVTHMDDQNFKAAWQRVTCESNLWEMMSDDVVLAMAVRAFSRKLASCRVMDNQFWETEKLWQCQMLEKLPRPWVVCFMSDRDFRLMLTKLSNNSFKKLGDSVKKSVIARCGDDFVLVTSKAALFAQVIKSKEKFLAS